jgi:hypothetical protein
LSIAAAKLSLMTVAANASGGTGKVFRRVFGSCGEADVGCGCMETPGGPRYFIDERCKVETEK